jgi:hypothetical protein
VSGPCVRVTGHNAEADTYDLCGSPDTSQQMLAMEIGGEIQRYMVVLCQFHITIALFNQSAPPGVAPDD